MNNDGPTRSEICSFSLNDRWRGILSDLCNQLCTAQTISRVLNGSARWEQVEVEASKTQLHNQPTQTCNTFGDSPPATSHNAEIILPVQFPEFEVHVGPNSEKFLLVVG